VYQDIQRRLRAISSRGAGTLLPTGKKGLEKESLRVSMQGNIATTPHPSTLGRALTHPYITTDYSEALLELITPPCTDNESVIDFLCNTHKFVYRSLKDELLWGASMPCVVAGDVSVPIANYGSSNSGMMRHIYRRGLAHRYGRVMQVISGVHYNYSAPMELWPLLQEIDGAPASAPGQVSERYFGLVRNVLRYTWLLVYLFGSSPALCRSFLGDNADRFKKFDDSTRYEPFATSLRMSDIGYTNKAQTSLNVRYDSLDDYVRGLTRAIETLHEPYRDIGVRVDGEYRQLNANILQIENEFYSPVRPKQLTTRGEKPTVALCNRGVAYVEVRSLDVNPFSSCGIDVEQMAFMEAFMLFCLLHESAPLSDKERISVDENMSLAAYRGREPGLRLGDGERDVPLAAWGLEVLEQIGAVAELLGGAAPAAVRTMVERVKVPDTTPSARLLDGMRTQGQGFYHFAMGLSQSHRDAFAQAEIEAAEYAQQRAWVATSIEDQDELERTDDVNFDEYLERYFAGT
jgi:glutamate--cysteine ligase